MGCGWFPVPSVFARTLQGLEIRLLSAVVADLRLLLSCNRWYFTICIIGFVLTTDGTWQLLVKGFGYHCRRLAGQHCIEITSWKHQVDTLREGHHASVKTFITKLRISIQAGSPTVPRLERGMLRCSYWIDGGLLHLGPACIVGLRETVAGVILPSSWWPLQPPSILCSAYLLRHHYAHRLHGRQCTQKCSCPNSLHLYVRDHCCVLTLIPAQHSTPVTLLWKLPNR